MRRSIIFKIDFFVRSNSPVLTASKIIFISMDNFQGVCQCSYVSNANRPVRVNICPNCQFLSTKRTILQQLQIMNKTAKKAQPQYESLKVLTLYSINNHLKIWANDDLKLFYSCKYCHSYACNNKAVLTDHLSSIHGIYR